MASPITRTCCFYNLYAHSQNETDSNLPSRREIVLLLDSGASILVPILPTYMMIARMFIVCNYDQHDTSNTLTIAIQTEVRIKQYVFVTCFSIIETKSTEFMILFAVADFEYNIVRTVFSEKYIQNFDVQNFTMNLKHSFNNQPTVASFTTLNEKTFPNFSFICRTNSKQPTYNKPNTVQITLSNQKFKISLA